jgi:hypothetical protein
MRKANRTGALPYSIAQPSHSASSATYIGCRVNAYGPLVSRSFGRQFNSTRSGSLAPCAKPKTMSQTRTAAPAAKGTSPDRFQNAGRPCSHP